MHTKIIGTGSYLPPNTMENTDLEKIVDTTDEWISGRTGIKKRRIATDDTTADMALKAALKAMDSAGIESEDLDLIIVGTISADNLLPSTACIIQGKLGAKNATAFDINAACSGFMYAMSVADSMIKNGMCKTGLIIGVETLSKITDWTDRGTCVLFGDGAGAAVISATNSPEGLLAMDMGSDGSKADALYCKSVSNNNPFLKEKHPCQEKSVCGYITMDGPAIFKFAVRQVPLSIERVLEKSDLSSKDIDLFVLHQANLRIIESISKRLKVGGDKFPHNMEECGNTSAASIPVLLDECMRNGRIQPGMKIVIAGFGAGLTWASSVLQF